MQAECRRFDPCHLHQKDLTSLVRGIMTRRSKKNRIVASERHYNDGICKADMIKRSMDQEVLRKMNYGAERRSKLIGVLLRKDGILVNHKHGIQLKYDPDLQKMLKQGVIVRSREGSFRTKHTILRVA